MGLAGMMLWKETYMLHVACAVIAGGVCYVSNSFSKLEDRQPAGQTWNYVDLVVVAGTGIALIVAFYCGFFFHWNGVKDLFLAWKPWFETGSQGHGHEKPWYYWLALICRYEWPTLIGLLVCVFALRFKTVALRYLSIYGVGTLIAYSIVKYKTPWCIISFIWPFLFTFGAIVTTAPMRFAAVTYRSAALVLFGLLAYAVYYEQAHNFNYVWPYALILGTALLLAVLVSVDIARVVAAVLLVWSLGHCIWS